MQVTDVSQSYWDSVAPSFEDGGQLGTDIDVEYAVIGGGFTGLNAAWNLHRLGASVSVLEAHTPGWGASGRNGGMAVLRYKHGWSKLAEKFGDATARLLFNYVQQAVDDLERNVEELSLKCDFRRWGHLTAAHSVRDSDDLKKDVQWIERNVKDYDSARWLSSAETADLVGASCYRGGYLDRRSAGINPLAYARTFAMALLAKGIPIYSNTQVLEMRTHNGVYELRTPHGRVRAEKVLITTNGYSALGRLPARIHRRIVPVTSSVIVTESLPEAVFRSILSDDFLVTDTRHLVNYFRRLPDNRILFGGRGSLSGAEKPATYQRLVEQLVDTYPVLRSFDMDYRWSGHVAVTLDDFPHVNQFADHGYFAMGYGGRGVALTHILGRLLAEWAWHGKPRELGPFGGPLTPIPLHDIRLPIMSAYASYYWLRDRLAS